MVALTTLLDLRIQRRIDDGLEDSHTVKVDRDVEQAAGLEHMAEQEQDLRYIHQIQKSMGNNKIVAGRARWGRSAKRLEGVRDLEG